MPSNIHLAQFLQAAQRKSAAIPADIPLIICAVARMAKRLRERLNGIDILNVTGVHGECNASGDVQQKLDMVAHQYCIEALQQTGKVRAVISEEAPGIVTLDDCSHGYIVAIDPLDGSSNIGVNAPLGTIFGIYRCTVPETTSVQLADVLQPGYKQLAAGYVLYGPTTMLVCTMGEGVSGFVYDPTAAAFLLAYPTLKMPETGIYYAINDGYFHELPDYVQAYLQECRQQHYKARYTGALVTDFHRHLMQGGIYLYPATHTHSSGRLRLLLECNALAFVAAQAGGDASSGPHPILSIEPQAIHQRVPLYIGSVNMVARLLHLAGASQKP
ncbi:MAG: class 1 fructose-bisphosphatase [Bacteroidota bacterium]